ncbi:MAG TPA: pyridoxamine 5'-phosphate oxidase family protein [Actinomycetota bacterium]|nr:pyridoxamine 5'-phosphate oxidase family protein [Actinomycetota bacterium]
MTQSLSTLNDTKVEILDQAECLALLATQRLGRLAVTRGADVGPHVVPVNYALLRQSIVFRSAPGTKLHRLVTEPVTFEVDSFDPFMRTGWSVVVEGLAYEASDREMEYEEVNLHPLLEKQTSRWARLVPRTITGRRITAGE